MTTTSTTTAIPRITGKTTTNLKGSTTQLGPGGMSTDYRSFTVGKAQDYNFTIKNPQTTVKILNSRNEVVATATAGTNAADAAARLAPGQYTAVIAQRYKGVNNRAYELEISERQNTMLTAGGALMRGTARPATSATDSGVQKHTLKVVQGGTFSIDMTLPNSRWAVMDKQGKVLASGDTMSTKAATNNLMEKKSYKLDPGDYEVVMVLPRDLPGETPWNLSFVAKNTAIEGLGTTKERDIDRILRERDERLRIWASQATAAKASSTKTVV